MTQTIKAYAEFVGAQSFQISLVNATSDFGAFATIFLENSQLEKNGPLITNFAASLKSELCRCSGQIGLQRFVSGFLLRFL